jgi:hypothetical protein
MPFWKRFDVDFAVKPFVLKLEEDSAVIKEEKVILSLKARTYGVPIMLDGEECGIVFLGEGDYLVNSRVKTYVGVYSKQYIDAFKDWGVIIGNKKVIVIFGLLSIGDLFLLYQLS